jgi:uncharacterized protein (DUF433 family)
LNHLGSAGRPITTVYIQNSVESMEREQIFHRDPEILGGTPVFVGTRVPVESLVQHLKHGKRLEEFLDDFPSVRREQAEAFLDLAETELLREDRSAPA